MIFKNGNIDKFNFTFILVIYFFLLIFFIVTLIFPSIFSKIAYQNKKQELGFLINKGIELSINREYEKSIRIFDEVINKMPELSETYVNKAVTLKTMKNFTEALYNLNLALKFGISDSVNVFLNFKDIYLELGDTNKAKLYLIKAVESTTSYIERNMILGNYYFNLRILDTSYFRYNQALIERFIPSNYIPDSVKHFLSENKINNFIDTDFDSISFVINLNYDRGLAENYNKIGVILAMEKKYDKALDYFYKAVNIWHEYKDANDNIRFIKEKIRLN